VSPLTRTDKAPHNEINQMSQTLSWTRPLLAPKTLAADSVYVVRFGTPEMKFDPPQALTSGKIQV